MDRFFEKERKLAADGGEGVASIYIPSSRTLAQGRSHTGTSTPLCAEDTCDEDNTEKKMSSTAAWGDCGDPDEPFETPTVLYQVGIETGSHRFDATSHVFVFGKEARQNANRPAPNRLCVVDVVGWMPSVLIQFTDRRWSTWDDLKKRVLRAVKDIAEELHVSPQQYRARVVDAPEMMINGYGYNVEREPFMRLQISDIKMYNAFTRNCGIQFNLYNAQVDPVSQFAIEVGMAEPNTLLQLPADARFSKCPRWRYENDHTWTTTVHVSQLKAVPNDCNFVPRLRVMSMDIECLGRDGKFPKSDEDPIIQLATVTTNDVIREPDATHNCAFVLGTCGPVENAHEVYTFDTEAQLLEAFVRHVRAVDPDVLTGFNVVVFDWPYVIDRCKIYDIKPVFGRRHYSSWWSYKTPGRTVLNTPDRIIVDMYTVVTAEHKLRVNSLNAVSEHFLNDRKEDMKYGDIAVFHNGTAAQRACIASYCVKDTVLPLQLMAKLNTVICVMEIANITGIPMKYVYGRGQQVRVMSQVAREGHKRGFVFPTTSWTSSVSHSDGVSNGARNWKRDEDEYQGATVIEPNVGFHEAPVVTLDFASLYPSIIIAFNLCYTTVIDAPPAASKGGSSNKCDDENKIKAPKRKSGDSQVKSEKAAEDDLYDHENPLNDDGTRFRYEQGMPTPTGDRFVPESKRRGILPEILVGLLDARRAVKKAMKVESDPFMHSVLNGRQLALKISANATYGFTGTAERGMLPCVAIGRSVTGYGRKLIEATTACVDTGRVIYGDTDSVMIRMPDGMSVGECMQDGIRQARRISTRFPAPISLEFEKVYKPYLLLSKKKYVGAMYASNADRPDKMDVKGMEMVRRDCSLYVSRVTEECMRKLVMDGDTETAVRLAQESVRKLTRGKVDANELVLSKKLTRVDYTNKHMCHLVVAEKMRKRGAETYVIGDRIDFVMIKELVTDPRQLRKEAETHPEQFLKTTKKKGGAFVPVRKVCYRAENPAYAFENNLPLDYDYYMRAHLENSLVRLFTHVVGGGDVKITRAVIVNGLSVDDARGRNFFKPRSYSAVAAAGAARERERETAAKDVVSPKKKRRDGPAASTAGGKGGSAKTQQTAPAKRGAKKVTPVHVDRLEGGFRQMNIFDMWNAKRTVTAALVE